MRKYERDIQERVLAEECQTVSYSVAASYLGPNPCDRNTINCAPTGVRIDADGSGPDAYHLHCFLSNDKASWPTPRGPALWTRTIDKELWLSKSSRYV
jgi:hypothetical protein